MSKSTSEQKLDKQIGMIMFHKGMSVKDKRNLIKKIRKEGSIKKNPFEIKEVHGHMQCGCKKTNALNDSLTNTVTGQRCECTITDGPKYAKNKKGGKTWKFGGIALGEDSSL